MRRRSGSLPILACAGIALATALLPAATARAGAPIEDALPPVAPGPMRESARSVLERAFDNLYGIDLDDDIEIEGRVDGKVARNHHLRVLRKNIDGRNHMLVRFVTKNDYWDRRVLKIENHDRSDDHFIWVPELRRIRRFTSVQRSDAFQGTDLTFEDLESHRAFRFEILGRAFSVLEGEPVHVLTIKPLYDLGYTRGILFVAQKDYAVLEAHYYRGENGRRPYKVSYAPREKWEAVGDHVLPRLIVFKDYERGTETWARYRERRQADELDETLFTAARLESDPTFMSLTP
jgi:hypothetical protein